MRHGLRNNLRFGWVDAGYGKGPGFCFALDEMGETFVVDLHCGFHVYLEDPKPYMPKKTNKRGRPFQKYRTDKESVEVGGVVGSFPAGIWKTMTLRGTT